MKILKVLQIEKYLMLFSFCLLVVFSFLIYCDLHFTLLLMNVFCTRLSQVQLCSKKQAAAATFRKKQPCNAKKNFVIFFLKN